MNFTLISKYRSALMGVAILLIIIHHLAEKNTILRIGYVGVDIFLFVSGLGLVFAWKKLPDIKVFYKRRFLRVYPTWLLIGGFFLLCYAYRNHELNSLSGIITTLVDIFAI